MDIDNLRKEIDITDKQIIDLFIKRINLCKEIAKIKKLNNELITNLNREAEVLSSISEYSGNYKNEALVLFKDIINISKRVQSEYIKSNDKI